MSAYVVEDETINRIVSLANTPPEIIKLQAEKERFLIVFNRNPEKGRGTSVDSRGSQEEVWIMLELLKRHLDSRFPEMFGFYHKPFDHKED